MIAVMDEYHLHYIFITPHHSLILMKNPAIERFIKDYRDYNRSLDVPHPYFQQIEYIKVNSIIIKEVYSRNHERILDCGSGAGHLINGLSAISAGCTALDIEIRRLVEARKKNPEIAGVAGDADFSLPFKTGTFNAVIASELLEHLNEPWKFFFEVARILKPGGVLILTTPNSENLSFKILRRMPKRMAMRLAARTGVDMILHPELTGGETVDKKNPHLHKVEGYKEQELVAMGRKYGLRTVTIRGFGLPVPDRAYQRLPKLFTRVLVNRLEDHIPYPLRHIAIYEKQINTTKTIEVNN
jgi:2-polyprenyl-3-methyl-5-hydroxy-6-metoxy-1,4-benzoquinol methylase